MTVVINLIIARVLESLVKWEKPASYTEYIMSKQSKIFWLQFINTALIVTIVNWSLFGGDYNDCDTGWFGQVGSALTVTMVLQIVVPQVFWALYEK